MVWKTGESGNPGGKKPGTMKDKPYRDALRMEIAALHEGDIRGLRVIARAHLNKCKDGDMAAIKELADRTRRQAGAGINCDIRAQAQCNRLDKSRVGRLPQ